MKGRESLAEQEALLAQAMRNALKGDSTAYRELLQSLDALIQTYVRGSLRRMGLEDPRAAEDLAQEILMAVHQKRHTYDPDRLFTPWLFAIARYKTIDFGRKRKLERGISTLESATEAELSSPVFSDPTTATDLQSLLACLPAKSRQALELVKLEGLSIAEAAAETQMSEAAIKVTIHRALKRLRGQAEKPPEPKERRK